MFSIEEFASDIIDQTTLIRHLVAWQCIWFGTCQRKRLTWYAWEHLGMMIWTWQLVIDRWHGDISRNERFGWGRKKNQSVN